MINLYESNYQCLFTELVEERKIEKRNWDTLSVTSLVKAWYSVVESTGGGAVANQNSEHKEEVALYHIEQAMKALKIVEDGIQDRR